MEKMAARWLHGCYVRAGTGQALVRPLEFPTFRSKFCFLVGFWRFNFDSQSMIEPGRASGWPVVLH
jgi:hypothetical protein